MKVELGIITSESHLPNLEIAEKKLNNLCNIHYFVSKNKKDIKLHFVNNYSKVDAFIFSGPILHKYLIDEVEPFDKPYYVIYDDLSHIYKEILTIFMNNPELKSNRVYIDFCSKENIKEFKDIFPKESRPYFLPWEPDNPERYSDFVLNNHLNLWKNDKIDLSITRFGLLIDEFKKNNIKFHFIQPSVEYLTEILLKAINEVKYSKLNNNRIAAIYISLNKQSSKYLDNTEKEISLLTIQSEILKMTKEKGYDFILQKKDEIVQIITTIEEIYKLTDKFKSCGIQNHIENLIKVSFSIGYGSGKNITQAQNNAYSALKESNKCSESCSYYVGENLLITGPLNKNPKEDYSFENDPYIKKLAEKTGLSQEYLGKITNYTKKISSNKLTSLNLSSILSIANRSANRILNKLVDKKLAKVNYLKKEASKGRPVKEYELLFLNNDGGISV
ncbi:MAG: hypothetical protein SCJ93_00870 [Bacillota bacterium]|nr:hypothetical protein [Bacillota bacterium]